MRGDFLDIILVLLAAAFAVGGYRQGFIVGVLGCAGFLVGATVGVICAPQVVGFVAHDPAQRALVAVIMVFLTAMAGQLLASVAGMTVRSRVTGHPAALADALGGAGVSVVSVLLIAAFLGSAVASVPFSAMSSTSWRAVPTCRCSGRSRLAARSRNHQARAFSVRLRWPVRGKAS